MAVLYWDAFAGISGDMALASLIDLGVNQDILISGLKSLPIDDFEISIQPAQVQGFHATAVDVIVTKELIEHRHLQDIEKIITSSTLPLSTIEKSLQVFYHLAEAEAKIHGTTIDKIHFHEVGAVDSIVDIVATCFALDLLEIEQVFVSTLPWSQGTVRCAHGLIPLPAPASVELLSGFVFAESGITGELITPTGAALLKTFARQEGFPTMKINKVGYGAGKYYYGLPNLLRAVLGWRE